MNRRTNRRWRQARSVVAAGWAVGALALFLSSSPARAQLEHLLIPRSIENDPAAADQAVVTADLTVPPVIEKLRQQLPAIWTKLPLGGRADLQLGEVQLAKAERENEVAVTGQAVAQAQTGEVQIGGVRWRLPEIRQVRVPIHARVGIELASGISVKVHLRIEQVAGLHVPEDLQSIGTWELQLPLAGVLAGVALKSLRIDSADNNWVGLVAVATMPPEPPEPPEPAGDEPAPIDPPAEADK